MFRKGILILGLAALGIFYTACGNSGRQESASASTSVDVQQGKTLESILERGKVVCGVNAHLPGFGYINEEGKFAGFDVDYCRALAAAIFGDPNRVEYRPLNAKERFAALQSGEVDILVRNTTWTLSRETDLGCNFAPTTFYDGQGMMVMKSSGIEDLKQLNGATIGLVAGTTTELNLADQMAALDLKYTPCFLKFMMKFLRLSPLGVLTR